MTFSLPKLPFELNFLEPFISKETLEYHYGKHHQAYVNKLNELIQKSEFRTLSLEEIIQKASGGIFNNAAQHFNHTFYWNCLSDRHDQQPSDTIIQALIDSFSSFEESKKKFSDIAIKHPAASSGVFYPIIFRWREVNSRSATKGENCISPLWKPHRLRPRGKPREILKLNTFGSGWTWLIQNEKNSLEIISTSNANTPIQNNQKVLLTCDVWEHAYYIDYRNARAKYLEAFWHLVNWKFVESIF